MIGRGSGRRGPAPDRRGVSVRGSTGVEDHGRGQAPHSLPWPHVEAPGHPPTGGLDAPRRRSSSLPDPKVEARYQGKRSSTLDSTRVEARNTPLECPRIDDRARDRVRVRAIDQGR